MPALPIAEHVAGLEAAIPVPDAKHYPPEDAPFDKPLLRAAISFGP
jgi:hypothetical protein